MIKKANRIVSISRGGINMTKFKEFLMQNNEKIRRVISENTVVNSTGAVVITKNDIWRKETEWDTMYKEIKK